MDRKNVKEILNIQTVKEADFAGHNWIFQAISYGILMFLLMAVIIPLCNKDSLTFSHLIKQFFIWMMGGVFYALFMKLFLRYFGNKKKE